MYIGNQPITQAFLTDQFSGNGSTLAFTMSVAPANPSSILVAITGVLQDPSTYAVSGTTLTFSSAPPIGTGNISVRYLGIPASGVTTTAYRTQTEFTATLGQTTFSVPSYTVGYIDVYRNGVKLGTADFTATSGTSVILANACSSGDLITTLSFYVSSVLNAIPAVANAVNSTYIADNAVGTSKIASQAVTPVKLSQPFTQGTAVASTSGTLFDFTGIPSWVKRITIMFSGMSTNGSAQILFQLGTSGGIVATGYLGSACYSQGGANTNLNSTGFRLEPSDTGVTSSSIRNGVATIVNLTGNTWCFVVNNGYSNANGVSHGGGSLALGGTLDRVRITTTNGTDTFDAGSINILYE